MTDTKIIEQQVEVIAPALVIVQDDPLLTQAARFIPASTDLTFCDVKLVGTPLLCTRAPHEDETHVAHDGSGRAHALWPIGERFALLRALA